MQCASDSEDGDVVLRCELSGFLRAGFCGLITEGSSIFKAEQLVYYVMPGLPLAYIGNVSRTTAARVREVFARRFRLGGKKEAAGSGVAVILEGVMDFE